MIRKIYFMMRKLKFIIKNMIPINLQGVSNLHIGCGERIIPGFLNCDIYNGDYYLDITKDFDFPRGRINFIYSHHVIEHITLRQLEKFLKNCNKILKDRGKIRLVTPDLKKLIKVYENKEEDVISYYCKDTTYNNGCEFINQELRQGGEHVYTYDFEMLKFLLEKHGFKNVRESFYGDSYLDDHGYEMIDRISLCVEAEK